MSCHYAIATGTVYILGEKEETKEEVSCPRATAAVHEIVRVLEEIEAEKSKGNSNRIINTTTTTTTTTTTITKSTIMGITGQGTCLSSS